VLGLVGADGSGDVHHGGDAPHGVGPARVVEQVGLHELEAHQRVLAGLGGDASLYLGGAAQRADGAPDPIAGLQQADHCPFAHKAGRAGNEDEPLVGHAVIPLVMPSPLGVAEYIPIANEKAAQEDRLVQLVTAGPYAAASSSSVFTGRSEE